MALDLESMLACARCTTLGAIERRESRGGHTREDYPKPDPELEKVNMVARVRDDEISVTSEAKPVMPAELRQLFEEAT
jgi:succinate dehydrogenase / fumarate reductase flavoprotein subunit